MGLRTVPFCSMLLINETELVRSKPNRARHLKFRIVIFDWFNWVVESWPFIIGPKCISLMGIEEEMVEMLQIGLACGNLKPQDRHNSADVFAKMIQDIMRNNINKLSILNQKH